ncbi:MAG: bifunctional DNA primase/polymerase [Microbacterium sp.]
MSAGLRVFPVRYGTKRPLVSEWQNRASSDPAQIKAWRAEFPGCNWGIRTGEGVGVIDLDTKKAPEWSSGGYGSLIDLAETGIDLFRYPLVRTPLGHHLYFRYEGHLTSLVPWLDLVDLLADGGRYVVAPGSIGICQGG